MRGFRFLAILVCVAAGGWWLWTYTAIPRLVLEYVENGEFLTLEARYTPDQIMEANKRELLVDAHHSYQEPELKFHPYLLMEVKYCKQDRRSCEGVILWSQVDGEMVLNTDTWEKTHGFEDAINAGATRNDFRLMNVLARYGGKASKEAIAGELQMDSEKAEVLFESARRKHLVVDAGDKLQLHLQNPKILVTPQTRVNHWFVTKPYNHAQKVFPKYTRSQIESIARASFGENFSIRNIKDIYLPVYSIEVRNPDGSVMTSYWNALNGKRVSPRYVVNGD